MQAENYWLFLALDSLSPHEVTDMSFMEELGENLLKWFVRILHIPEIQLILYEFFSFLKLILEALVLSGRTEVETFWLEPQT